MPMQEARLEGNKVEVQAVDHSVIIGGGHGIRTAGTKTASSYDIRRIRHHCCHLDMMEAAY